MLPTDESISDRHGDSDQQRQNSRLNPKKFSRATCFERIRSMGFAPNVAAQRMNLWNVAKKYNTPLARRRQPIQGGDSNLA
eukprot:5350847-Karenia_brevis.AAC.1